VCGYHTQIKGARQGRREVKSAKDDGRLPMEDHNTRFIVFGQDRAQAQAVTKAIAQEALHNVAYVAGIFETLLRPMASK
jgi:hypothetical protein